MPSSMSELFQPLRMMMELDERERRIASTRMDQIRKAREAEDKRINSMLDMFWKAATDENTPKALFENIQGMAQQLTRNMTKEQMASFDAVVSRGLFSKTDRLSDEFRRIYGNRPSANFESVNIENLGQFAEAKVSQVEWDYKHRAYLAGGKDKLGEGSAPSLIPITQLEDKEGNPHNIFAYRDGATGLVRTINTKTDVPGELYNKAKKDGFGPSMMSKTNFIPFNAKEPKLVTIGDQQHMMFTGVRLTDSQSETRLIPVGEVADKSKTKPIQPPSSALDTVAWIDAVTRGGLDADKAGKYIGWVKKAQAMENIAIKKDQWTADNLPSLGSDYGKSLVVMQRDFNLSHPGWAIAPTRVGDKEPTGIPLLELFSDNYYAEDAEWTLFPSDGERALLFKDEEGKSKPRMFHYKESLGDEKNIWFDYYGRRISKYSGLEPGTLVEN